MSDECICKGNWRAIVGECEGDIGKRFADRNGVVWTFFGVVHGDDDYYYGMCRQGQMTLLSCVGDLDVHGFKMADK